MSKKTVPIKNIIFDLGGVLVDVDYEKGHAAFSALGIDDPKTNMGREEDKKLFGKYETGKADTEEVTAHIRSLSSKAPTDEDVIAAMNAIIVGFPAERITLLHDLKPKVRLFLLSNLNPVHHARVHEIYRETYGGIFDDHFEKPYYSHLIGRRKPDPAAFMHVITDAGIKAKETLFIDDMPENLRGASLAGLQTAHVAPDITVMDLGLDKI